MLAFVEEIRMSERVSPANHAIRLQTQPIPSRNDNASMNLGYVAMCGHTKVTLTPACNIGHVLATTEGWY
jgi:hypothetical protein